MNKAKIEESHKRRKEQLAQEQLEKNLKLLEEDQKLRQEKDQMILKKKALALKLEEDKKNQAIRSQTLLQNAIQFRQTTLVKSFFIRLKTSFSQRQNRFKIAGNNHANRLKIRSIKLWRVWLRELKTQRKIEENLLVAQFKKVYTRLKKQQVLNALSYNRISQQIANEKYLKLVYTSQRSRCLKSVLQAWRANVFELKKDNYFERKRYEELVKGFRRVLICLVQINHLESPRDNPIPFLVEVCQG